MNLFKNIYFRNGLDGTDISFKNKYHNESVKSLLICNLKRNKFYLIIFVNIYNLLNF